MLLASHNAFPVNTNLRCKSPRKLVEASLQLCARQRITNELHAVATQSMACLLREQTASRHNLIPLTVRMSCEDPKRRSIAVPSNPALANSFERFAWPANISANEKQSFPD
jgi:hypothetical protein